MLGDPFTMIGNIIVGIYETHKVQQWVSLIFQASFSSVVVFCSTCGTALMASKSWPFSVGLGMFSMATVLVAFFIKSKLTKGMLLIAPADVMKAEKDDNLTEIQK